MASRGGSRRLLTDARIPPGCEHACRVFGAPGVRVGATDSESNERSVEQSRSPF